MVHPSRMVVWIPVDDPKEVRSINLRITGCKICPYYRMGGECHYKGGGVQARAVIPVAASRKEGDFPIHCELKKIGGVSVR